METPGFLPAWSLPQPQPTPPMEAQSQLEGSMLTRSPPAPCQVLCSLGGWEDCCQFAQPGQLPGTASHTARRAFRDRPLKVAILTTSAGSPGRGEGAGFPLVQCPLSSQAVVAAPSGAGDEELLPRLGGTSPPRRRTGFQQRQPSSGAAAAQPRWRGLFPFTFVVFHFKLKLSYREQKTNLF